MKKENYVFGTLTAIFLLLVGYEIYNFRSGGHHVMMSGGHIGGTGHMTSHTISLFNPISLIIIILIAAFLYTLLKDNKEEIETDENNAVKILKERYAKGEINREEYLKIFKDIVKKEQK